MAAIKSYTDLEQSRKLAEILPLESADMYYKYVLPESDRIFHTPEIGNPINSLKWYNEGYTFSGKRKPITLNDYCVPCWSLAALLDVLPDEISTGEGYQNKYEIDIRRYYGGNNITLYQIAYGNNKGSSGSWHDIISTSEQEKFVNVCYEMIIKLHEQNLL